MCSKPYLYLFSVLTLDLMSPSAFLFLYLLIISVVDINDTICARCWLQRARNLVEIKSRGRCQAFLHGNLFLEMGNCTSSEVMGGTPVLVGLRHKGVEDKDRGLCECRQGPAYLDVGLWCGGKMLVPPRWVVEGRRSLKRLARQVAALLAVQNLPQSITWVAGKNGDW
jgi:hypothetical protein